jgi:hypothetical protein
MSAAWHKKHLHHWLRLRFVPCSFFFLPIIIAPILTRGFPKLFCKVHFLFQATMSDVKQHSSENISKHAGEVDHGAFDKPGYEAIATTLDMSKTARVVARWLSVNFLSVSMD